MGFIRATAPLICGALGLAGCSGPDVLNALTPGAGYELTADIAYGDHPRQRLDVYVPADGAPAKATIVYFYGGSWQVGAKDDYRFLGQAFAARGYRVVVPNYRLYPEIRYPAFLEDSAAAVVWAQRAVGDAAPLFLMGHSAGAYNAAMLALDARWLTSAGVSQDQAIDGFVGLAGPYDFLPLVDPNLMAIFGPKETRDRTQPITYVTTNAPPMLLLTGNDDTTVLPKNSRNLAAKLNGIGGKATLKEYSGVGHLRIIGAIAWPMRFIAPTLEDTDAFFNGLIQTPGSS